MNNPSVFFFLIDLTLTAAVFTENGQQNKLKWQKCHFGQNFGGLTDMLHKAQANTKKIFK